MKLLVLIYFLSLLNVSCISNGTSSDEKVIQVSVKDNRIIPENTIKIVDFDRVFIKSENKLKLVSIENPNELKTLYEIVIPPGKNFEYFLNDRFVIFEDPQGVYSQMVFDILTGKTLELNDENYSTAVKSINPKDNSILYTNQIYHPELKGLLNKLYLTTFGGTSKFISDSVGWASWSPNGSWIFLSKFSYKEGYYWRRHTKIINLYGKEIELFDESVSTFAPIWTNDGSNALFRLNQGSGEIAVVEFNWSDEQPQIKQVSFGEHYYEPAFWSPCGQYFIYSKEHSDGHTLFGNDIFLANKDLNLNTAIITHEDVYELPITWTSEYGLITRKQGQIVSYEITY